MTKTYKVKNWSTYFEKAQTKRCLKAYWVPIPNKHDGKSYRRIARHEHSAQIFSAWILILQVASKMDVRGVLADEDGPLNAEDLSDMTGFPLEMFEIALAVLMEPKIGWLECSDSG